jgi:hypothetical protein
MVDETPCAGADEAYCQNATCVCKPGYAGDIGACEDVDECTNGANNCDGNATCTNTPGSFTCACNAGFEGDGVTCSDIDECANGANNCDGNATCTNTPGSFSCACNNGYEGDGVTCTKNPCVLAGSYNVHDGPSWGENPPTYTCLEACALVLGGSAGDYACSTNDNSVTHTGYYSGWGDGAYCSNGQPENWKVNSFYNCGGSGCAYSAYVSDHCASSTNYCWKGCN